jgi:hypothetical protein
MNSPTIITDRLNVFVFDFVASETLSLPRRFYVGYHKEEDWPGHVVTATVALPINGFPAYLDWIETNTTLRRQGFVAEERFIDTHVPDVPKTDHGHPSLAERIDCETPAAEEEAEDETPVREWDGGE